MVKTLSRGIKPISYEMIAEELLLGQTIQDQLKTFNVPKDTVCNGRRAILLKVLRVYNVQVITTGHA